MFEKLMAASGFRSVPISEHFNVQKSGKWNALTFNGTSENAVKTRIGITVPVYVPVTIVKKQLNLSASLYTILQILSLTLLEKTQMLQVVTNVDDTIGDIEICNQLNLSN